MTLDRIQVEFLSSLAIQNYENPISVSLAINAPLELASAYSIYIKLSQMLDSHLCIPTFSQILVP